MARSRAENQRYQDNRERRAVAAGFTGYGQQRAARERAKREGVAPPTTYGDALRRNLLAPRVLRAEAAGRGHRYRQRTETAAGVVYTSTQLGVIRRAVLEALERDELVTFRVTFVKLYSGVPQQRYINGVKGTGTPPEPTGRPAKPVGPVVVVTVDHDYDGLRPGPVLQAIAAAGPGSWDWLADLWEAAAGD